MSFAEGLCRRKVECNLVARFLVHQGFLDGRHHVVVTKEESGLTGLDVFLVGIAGLVVHEVVDEHDFVFLDLHASILKRTEPGAIAKGLLKSTSCRRRVEERIRRRNDGISLRG